MKYKLPVYETCLHRHHPIVNDRNHQKANAISVSRICMHLKSIVLNHKNAFFLIPPFSQSIPNYYQGSQFFSRYTVSHKSGLICFLNNPRPNNKKNHLISCIVNVSIGTLRKIFFKLEISRAIRSSTPIFLTRNVCHISSWVWWQTAFFDSMAPHSTPRPKAELCR